MDGGIYLPDVDAGSVSAWPHTGLRISSSGGALVEVKAAFVPVPITGGWLNQVFAYALLDWRPRSRRVGHRAHDPRGAVWHVSRLAPPSEWRSSSSNRASQTFATRPFA